ncbi:MAG: substrate-binding domain-containing protein [bacterium]|nr:substrate-binding domain-containing protein [bacterium]
MGRSRVTLVLALLIAIALAPSTGQCAERLKLATTTSTANSGLLEVLIPPFEKRFGLRVDVIPVGTGKALKLGRTGDVDVVLVHARAAEERFVAEGYGVNRRDVMYNDFVLLGPPADPAKLKEASTLHDAMRRLARSRAPFLSRGDDSGTHKKERKLWAAAGITPAGPRYLETGRGMGETLIAASEKQGYVLSDRGTYLAMKPKLELEVVFEGDEALFNPYGIIAVNPARHPHTNYVMALAFIGWVTSPEGQRIINGYRKGGKVLFHPLAVQLPGADR